MEGRNMLTPEQVEQLVDVAAQSPLSAWTALRWGQRFTPEQQQKLVDGACKSPVFAVNVLNDVPWLTDAQKAQLSVVA